MGQRPIPLTRNACTHPAHANTWQQNNAIYMASSCKQITQGLTALPPVLVAVAALLELLELLAFAVQREDPPRDLQQ